MRLSDCFIELIAYTAFLAHTDQAGQPSFDQVKNTMQRLIKKSEACLAHGAVSHEDYQLARFAVFAWVDETLMSSDWQGRQLWQREQLQRQYYQTADAGELFFERLNTLGLHQRDVREVFYLCLSLGFTGQYCNPGDDFLLTQLRVSNLKLLIGSSTGVPKLEKEQLFPDACPVAVDSTADAVPQQRFSGFTLGFALAPVALYGVLYLIYLFILGNIGDKLIGTVP